MRYLFLTSLLLVPQALAAQPALETLWPNTDGFRWIHRIDSANTVEPSDNFTATATLWFDGEVPTAGGPAQMLHGAHPVPAAKAAHFPHDPLLARVWQARPDLRPRLAARAGNAVAGDATGCGIL